MAVAVEHKIYTRKGDAGNTRLFSGETVSKSDLRVQAYGTLDELQAHLGMVRALMPGRIFDDIVLTIQRDLSVACAQLASTPEGFAKLGRRIGADDVAALEGIIDQLVSRYGLPSGFIVPGRSADSAAAHVARTVCRRGERLVVEVNGLVGGFDDVAKYLNRLSDLLFALAWSLEVLSVVTAVAEDVRAERS
jgi:cob(I)alamin adenosyltransferase